MHKFSLLFLAIFPAVTACQKGADERDKGAPARLAVTDSKSVGQARDYPPLPEGPDFRSIEDTLRQRAAKNDPLAQCQLATELDFCAASTALSDQVARATSSAIKGTGAVPAAENTTLSGISAARMQYCKGSNVDTTAQRIMLWERAAKSGHLPAVLRYTSGSIFPNQEMLGVLPQLNAYRANALPLLERAAQDGSVQANMMLAKAYSPLGNYSFRANLLSQLVKKEKSLEQSIAYLQMAQKLLETPGIDDGFLKDEINISVAEANRQYPAPDASKVNRMFQELILSNRGLGRAIVVPVEQDSERALFSTTPERGVCGAKSAAN
ncbi:MAG: hypothetical protein ACREXR_07195 [Gammaproteobacteria bacterium]